MTRFFLSVFLFVCPLFLLGQSDLESIRELFHQWDNQDDLNRIIQLCDSKSDQDNSTIKAYKGICKASLAEYAFWPITKLNYFNDGVELLENSIETNQNLENTYLRLLLQLNAPSMLGYDENIKSDLEYFTSHIRNSGISRDYQSIFIQSLKNSKNIQCDLSPLDEILN